MAKEKKDKPTLNFDGVEYAIDDMSDNQKELAAKVINDQNHVNDLQNKLRTNMFVNEQLVASEKHFSKKLEDGKAQLKAVLESEDKAAA
jgi:hypothetical protein